MRAHSAGFPTIPESLTVKDDEGFGTDALFSSRDNHEPHHGIVIIAVAVFERCLEFAIDRSVLAGQEFGQVCLGGDQNQVLIFEDGNENLKTSINFGTISLGDKKGISSCLNVDFGIQRRK